MDQVSIAELFDAPRRTLQVRDGAIVLSEDDLDEALKDFLKRVGQKLASKAKRAIARVTGGKDDKRPVERPPPSVPKPKAPESPNDRASSDKPKAPEPQQTSEPEAKRKARDAVNAAVEKAAAEKNKGKQSKEKMRAALDKLAADRKERSLTRKEKEQAAGTASTTHKEPADMVPAQVAHCVLAVHKKRGKSVRAAWNICRWSLTKYGYLKGPYRINTKLPKAVQQTGKGARRTMQHAFEKHPLNGGVPGSPEAKYKMFKDVFRDIEPDVVPKR